MRNRVYSVLHGIAVVLVCAGVWYLGATAPVRLPVAAGDGARISGVWGAETDGAAWTKAAARITPALHGWVPWRVVALTIQLPPASTAVPTLQLGNLSTPVVGAAVPRRVVVLDRVAGAAPLEITSATTLVAGDRRALGVRISDITVERLAVPTHLLLWFVAGWCLPLVAAAVWLARRGWPGLGAWLGLAALHVTVLVHELTAGYAAPTLLLVSPWRELLSAGMLLAGVWPRRSTDTAPADGRRIGLDLLRAVAVGCVVVAHSLPLLWPSWSSDPAVFRWFVTAGDVGVDIFFALSGFLIGAILLRQLPDLQAWPAVQRFWARRWLRTLPAAYVSALVVWVIAAPRDVAAYLRSIAFVGTIDPRWLPSEMGFWWSLGAEETFYVCAPLAIWLLLRFLPRMQAFVVAVCGLAVFSLLVRIGLVWILPSETAGNVSYAIYARLDSMMWGVALAMLKRTQPAGYAWIAQHGAPVGLVVGACGVMLLLDTPRWFVVSVVAAHIATTVGAALLIPALERWHTLGFRALDTAVRGLALVSYSVYLYHSMWEQRVHAWYGSGQDWVSIGRNSLLYLGGTLLLAAASYWLVERPVLAWRDSRYADPPPPR